MGRNHYLGGGTLVGPGCRWSDHAEFPENKSKTVISDAKKKKKKKRKFKLPPMDVRPTISPQNYALIASVMSDLGRKLPTNLLQHEKTLRKLISDGVILANGEMNRSHYIFSEWLQKIERKERKLTSHSSVQPDKLEKRIQKLEPQVK